MTTKTVTLTDEKIKALREKISQVLTRASNLPRRSWCLFCCALCPPKHEVQVGLEIDITKSELNKVVDEIITILNA